MPPLRHVRHSPCPEVSVSAAHTSPQTSPAAPAPRKMRLDIILLACSLFYLVAEFIFNARLLDTASDILATSDDLRDVEYFGRAVSGIGLSLLVAGFFARDGFRLSRKTDLVLLGVLVVVCPLVFLLSPLSPQDGGLDPAGVTFTQLITGSEADINMAFPPPDASMMWIILPFIGIFMVLVSLYLKLPRIVTAGGILMMTWPAMFFGQKIVIERFAIHPTTWETRLDARYMQMMRTGFGHGIIALRDLRFDKEDDPALRTFLVLMGSMFMQFPDEAKAMIREKEQDIVQLIVMRADIDNTEARYGEYQEQVDKFRKEFYEPYASASTRYNEALSEEFLHKTRDQILKMAHDGIDKGWLKMRDSLGTCRAFAAKHAPTLYTNLVTYNNNFVACTTEECRNRIAINYRRMVRNMIDVRVPFDYWCESSNIDPLGITTALELGDALRDVAKRETFACRPQSLERTIERLMPMCTQEIQKQTGISAAIRTREEFEKSPRMQAEVRKRLLQTLRREHKMVGFVLPDDWWINDVATLEDALARSITIRAGFEWMKGETKSENGEDTQGSKTVSMSGLKPGLSFEEFVASGIVQRRLRTALGGMYYPGFSMSLDREQFLQNVIAPDIKRRALVYVRRMEEQAKNFANGERLEAQGKEAVRFIYIPSIALFISLSLVILTLARCIITAVRLAWRHKYPDARPSPARVAIAWCVVGALLIGFPYIAGSRTAQSESYQDFLHRSLQRAPVTSALLDWTMRAQPIIYTAGKSLLDIAGVQTEHTPRNLRDFAPVIVFDSTYSQTINTVQQKLIDEKLLEEIYGGGIMNNQTREGLLRYQELNGLLKTGEPDAATLKAMQIAPATAPPDTPAAPDTENPAGDTADAPQEE